MVGQGARLGVAWWVWGDIEPVKCLSCMQSLWACLKRMAQGTSLSHRCEVGAWGLARLALAGVRWEVSVVLLHAMTATHSNAKHQHTLPLLPTLHVTQVWRTDVLIPTTGCVGSDVINAAPR